MATVITPPGALPDLESTLEWIESIKVSDLPPNERVFIIEVDGRLYRIEMPFEYVTPRRYWLLTVNDQGESPNRGTHWPLGYQWEFEYALDTVASDVATYYQ